MRPLRIQLAEELLSFYKFLTTLHIPAEALKIPPAEGWPEETIRKHFAPNEKDEAVIDLLKCLPYIAHQEPDDYQIWEGCTCNDFSGPPTGWNEPLEDEEMDGCGWPPLENEHGRYIATLGRSRSRDGWWLFCDVRTGEMVSIDFQMEIVAKRDNPRAWAEHAKESYCKLSVFPLRPEIVQLAVRKDEDAMQEIRNVFHRHGWPDGDFQKDECMAELAKI